MALLTQLSILLIPVFVSELNANPCSNDLYPVCGQNGHSYRTFASRCLLEAYNTQQTFQYKFVGLGHCKCIGDEGPIRRLAATCPRVCTMDYKPMCAFSQGEYVTFGNHCAMTSHNCNFNRDFYVVFHGECKCRGALKIQVKGREDE